MSARISVLVNQAAGSGTGHDAIRAAFQAAASDVHLVALDGTSDPTDLAARLAADGGLVVAAGGDGTVSSVAAGLAGTGATLGVLPTGTLNHFAKDLGIPLGLEDAVATVLRGQVTRVDVGAVNGRVFVNACSIGVYPNIVAIRESLREGGSPKWPAMAVGIYRVLREYRGVHVRMAPVGGRVSEWRTPFLFVGNNEYAIDGRQLGGRATLADGQLVAYLAPRAKPRDLPLLLGRALLGRASQSGAFKVIRGQEFVVDIRPARPRIALDGELVTLAPPLRFELRPGALRVMVPEAQA